MLGAIILAGFAALLYFARQAGRVLAENDRLKEVLDDLEKANNARADLNRSPDAGKRMRERFTR
jgi:hypothetical protein